jgi:hypothetical protein
MSRRRIGVASGVVVVAFLGVLLAVVAPGRAERAVPRCTADQLALQVTREGVLGALVPTITIWHVSGPTCRFERRISLAVKTPSGAFLGIKGNPARHRFDRSLAPGHGVFAGFAWRNWCHRQGAVTYRFTVGSRVVQLRSSGRPSCNQHGSPSTLRLLGVGSS